MPAVRHLSPLSPGIHEARFTAVFEALASAVTAAVAEHGLPVVIADLCTPISSFSRRRPAIPVTQPAGRVDTRRSA